MYCAAVVQVVFVVDFVDLVVHWYVLYKAVSMLRCVCADFVVCTVHFKSSTNGRIQPILHILTLAPLSGVDRGEATLALAGTHAIVL